VNTRSSRRVGRWAGWRSFDTQCGSDFGATTRPGDSARPQQLTSWLGGNENASASHLRFRRPRATSHYVENVIDHPSLTRNQSVLSVLSAVYARRLLRRLPAHQISGGEAGTKRRGPPRPAASRRWPTWATSWRAMRLLSGEFR